MKFYTIQILITALLVVVLSACNWLDSNNTTATSNDANFVSLKFTAAHTADAAVANAKFTLQLEGTDSVLVNLDSLPVNTAIDSVIPTISFRSTLAVWAVRKDETGNIKDSVLLTGKDTLNFNQIVRFTNKSSDGSTLKMYKVKVNVHTLDPELYQWIKTVDRLYTHASTEQKTVILNNTICFFNTDGLTTSLYTSADGKNWSDKIVVSELPQNALIGNMLVYNNKIFLIHNDSLIYSTTNGTTWVKGNFESSNYWFKNLLYDFKGKLWALVQTKADSNYHFASSENGNVWEVLLSSTVPYNFPVGGYAALSFFSRTKQPKVLVAGGYSKDGVALNNVWSSADGTYWLDFSKENTTFGYRKGAALVYYEDKLLLLGGADDTNKLPSLLFLQSADEGLSWKAVDSTTMTIRQKYTFIRNDSTIDAYKKYARRIYQSAVVDKDKNIILVGGRDSIPQTFTDVWVGRLNKAVFIRK